MIDNKKMEQMQQLSLWLSTFLPKKYQANAAPQLSPVSGDAGFRSYYRFNSSPSVIAVIAPPKLEDIPSFVDKAVFFRGLGLKVPEVLAVDYQQGFMMIEDFGDKLLLPLLNNNSAASLYGLAESALQQLAVLPASSLFEEYNEAKLQQEMALFPEWFVEQLLGYSLDDKEREMLQALFKQLCNSALAQPQVLVHRDYHSRNLLLTDAGDLGIIDFQDAVLGPISYDLVSLLKDCYIRWPEAMVKERLKNYYQQCCQQALLADVSFDDFMRGFDWMGLQRHIKVLGIFARLSLRDGKQQYLQDLPLVIRYTLECSRAYAELQPFSEWFETKLLPLIEKKPWYSPWQSAGDLR